MSRTEVTLLVSVLPDEDVPTASDLRVFDESSENYLFPAAAIVAISPPERVRSSLRHTAAS